MICINVKTNHIKNPLNVTIQRIDWFKVETTYLSGQLSVNANRVDNILNVYCHKVCDIAYGRYLNVLPNIVWLTPDEFNTATFDIRSNVFWKID